MVIPRFPPLVQCIYKGEKWKSISLSHSENQVSVISISMINCYQMSPMWSLSVTDASLQNKWKLNKWWGIHALGYKDFNIVRMPFFKC